MIRSVEIFFLLFLISRMCDAEASCWPDSLRRDSIVHDTDMWTPGQLINFSSRGAIVRNSSGRVVSGMLGVNTIILCADNVYREFARGFVVEFDSQGRLLRGTPAVSVVLDVQGQVVASRSYSEVVFYPNGVVKSLIPIENFKYVTDDGSRIVVSSSGMVYFSRDGKISKATLARRVVSIGAEGRMKSHGAGDVIFIDDDGSILDR